MAEQQHKTIPKLKYKNKIDKTYVKLPLNRQFNGIKSFIDKDTSFQKVKIKFYKNIKKIFARLKMKELDSSSVEKEQTQDFVKELRYFS